MTPHLAASTDEAQDRAGLIVAEQVVAALEGGLVTNAVNIPVVGAEDLEVLGPYIPLAAKLGRLAIELAGGQPRRIALSYHGALAEYDTRLLTVAALNGAFQGRVEQAVNYVNAPVIAAERGIDVSEQRSARRHATTRTSSRSPCDGVEVSGTTIGPEHRLFLAGALGFAIDLELSPRMVFFRYDDMPGRDRTRRHDVRRGRREHREHGRVAHEGGRQGADGALDRLRAARGARRADPRRGLRRCQIHRPRLARRGASWPEPVERVAAYLREAGAEARLEELESGTATAEDAAARRRLPLGQIVKSIVVVCDGRPVVALVPGDRRARSEEDRRRGRRSEGSDRERGGGGGGDRLSAGRRRSVPAAEASTSS